MPGNESADIAFEAPVPETHKGRNIWSACGKTKVSEDLAYQPEPVDICVYWTSVPDYLVVPQHGSQLFTFAMTADKNRTVAKEEMYKGN